MTGRRDPTLHGHADVPLANDLAARYAHRAPLLDDLLTVVALV